MCVRVPVALTLEDVADGGPSGAGSDRAAVAPTVPPPDVTAEGGGVRHADRGVPRTGGRSRCCCS